MKRFRPDFNKKSRLTRTPQVIAGDSTPAALAEIHDLETRLPELLQVQNDFYPCFDWTFPPPILPPASQPGLVAQLLSEPAIIPGRYSLYLHTPFCKTLCNFCYYTVFPGKGVEQSARYVDYLLREMQLYAPHMEGQSCESVYLGGGTPTYLDDYLLIRLIEGIRQHFDLAPEAEITIEAAPGTLSPGKVDLLRALGVNRLSYGIQTLDEALLAGMNRYYSVNEAIEELTYARRVIGNVNVDTMYGFDGESDHALRNTLETFVELDIPSLSIYALDRQRCQTHAGEGPPEDEHYQRKIALFSRASDYLDSQGYRAVLQNIFVKPEAASYEHQLRRWDNLTLLALGISSQGYAPRKPYQNAMTLKSYYQLLDEGKPPIVSVDVLSPEMEMAREITSKLRFTEISLQAVRQKYGVNLEEVFGELVRVLKQLGYLEQERDILRMSPQASYYNNIIPMLFAPDEFKSRLLDLPAEYLEQFPLPRILTQLGKTQSQPIEVKGAAPASRPRRERRQHRDRRQSSQADYRQLTGGIERRRGYGRRLEDYQRGKSFVGEFV
ncbi:MAG: coproporphyrinogen-III oxidase family protein [Thiohalophilus sp.]|uniref:coproporphyrinogen-III oxidase family protein n=1 Tax=Thiohalophilus sp. TaxID=3028392 RepID=UPI00286FE6B1|nr:coproporphyrinogen-III oxidase family protein [Thiohalophilus sp.]MDR9437688.1 coproporphyrinogen-III oxidase family protein [Thiohalophilus sp.]